MKTILFLLTIISILSISNSQVQQQWIQRFNGPGNYNDVGYAMTLDANGNIYVTGTISALIGTDIGVIKYNSAGTQLWQQTFSGGNHDAAFAIVVDQAGNVYIAGTSLGGNGDDYVTAKYNSSGTLQWAQFYEGPGFDADDATSLAVDASGNVYVTGYSSSENLDFDYATIKYNSAGAEQWVRRFDFGNGEDVASSLVLDGSGNIYVTGRSNYDYTTIKYNPAGIQQWIQTYDGPANGADHASFIKIDGSNNLYVSGVSTGIGTAYDYTTVKYNS